MMKHWLAYALIIAGLAVQSPGLAMAEDAGEAAAPEAAANADTAGLEAQITITGSDLLPREAQGEAGVQDRHNWLARVIDPTESVDRVLLPDSATAVSYHGAVDYRDQIIAVQFSVPLDLSGGEAGSTPVEVMIPVEFDSAGVTQVEAEIGLGQLADKQWVIDVNYRMKCGTRLQRQRCRLYWGSGQLVFDRNGDGVYEPVSRVADPDRNCLGGKQRWRRGASDGAHRDDGGKGARDGQGRQRGNGNGQGGRHAGT